MFSALPVLDKIQNNVLFSYVLIVTKTECCTRITTFTRSEELDITQQYTHGDLKCSNILVKIFDDYLKVKIGDLGSYLNLRAWDTMTCCEAGVRPELPDVLDDLRGSKKRCWDHDSNKRPSDFEQGIVRSKKFVKMSDFLAYESGQSGVMSEGRLQQSSARVWNLE